MNPDQRVTVTYPLKFPSSVYCIQLTRQLINSSDYSVTLYNITTSKFEAQNAGDTHPSQGIYWLALGK